jgi:hypothetical protein
MDSATPSVLLNIIKNYPQPKMLQNEYVTDLNALEEGYLPSSPEEMLVLFQSGYLTVKKVDDRGRYTLGYPNTEVRQAMSEYLLSPIFG